ncbi:divergent polysaccharide deacetylase family protein [uncultured Treponema sp.]|uniref:divergent polysaccharide deacetylase family protein n=1 Tax=uncultured Treponema sp. TaxID=162155 RepID=UPI0025EE6BAE|nr:divergent polysaccharide deacetylase family protein [uncultured Treponema sp.]
MLDNKSDKTRKTSTTKRTSSTKKSGGTKSRTRAKKPKVQLAKNKVILLSSLISGICVLALAMSVVFNQTAPQPVEKSSESVKITSNTESHEKIEKTAQTVKPTVQTAKPVQTAKSPVQTEKPVQTAKSNVQTEKPAQTTKSTVQTTKPAQTAKTPVQTEKTAQTAKPTVQTAKPVQTAKSTVQTEKPALATKSTAPQLASSKTPYNEEQIQKNIPKNRFDIPPASNGATIVIVIDDAGRSVENTKRYTALPFPITIAVLPRLAQSRACANAVREAGKELILHQPMQATNLNLDPGPGAIKADMTSYQIASIIKANFQELGQGVRGINNHEGSLITSNEIKIGAVLEVCNEMGVYFLDSRTTAATKAPQAALERDMTIFEKAGPYLDNDIDRAKMLERMRETLAYANRHGRAIVIGHVDKSVKILPDLLAEMYPEIKAAGYRFATPSQLR